MSGRTLDTGKIFACTALAVAVFAVGACSQTDRNIPTGIKGGDDPAGTGGDACYGVVLGDAPGGATITLDPTKQFQTMEGFGASMRLFDDPQTTGTLDPATKRGTIVPTASDQSVILDALYVDLGLTRARFFPGDAGGIEPVNDNADPLVADPSKFDFSWNKGDGQIALIPDLNRRGLRTFFNSTRGLEPWMTSANPEEYAEWLLVTLRHWRDKGAEMPYVSLKNEPGNSAAGGVWSGDYLRSVTKILGARIKAEGMATKIVVSEDANATDAYDRIQAVLSDADARQYVGAIAYHHNAPGGEDKIKALGAQYNVPIWVTEAANGSDYLAWATDLNDLIANDGVSAVDYKWGFYGDYDPSQLVSIAGSGGTYNRFIKTQQYYVMGQYSRFVRPGAVRIAATSNDPEVFATAYVDGFKLIVVATFTGTLFERPISVDLGKGGPCVKRMDPVRTSASDSWNATARIVLNSPRFNAALPARSVTTFVGQQ